MARNCVNPADCVAMVISLKTGTLENEERDNAMKLGLIPGPSKGKGDHATFQQPCSCYRNNICTVYSERPRGCRNYECDLLKGFMGGKFTFEESMKLVDKVKVLIKVVKRYMGIQEFTKFLWHHVEDFLNEQRSKTGADDFEKVHAEFLFDVGVLLVISNERFEPKISEGDVVLRVIEAVFGKLTASRRHGLPGQMLKSVSSKKESGTTPRQCSIKVN